MMMSKELCEQCCHCGVCYKYEAVIAGKKTYADFFGDNCLCLDLLILTTMDDGKTEEFTVDTNIYDIIDRYDDCTVEVLKSSVTGEVSIGWWRNDNPPFLIGVD